MYLPPLFKEEDQALVLKMMRENPLANLISSGHEPCVSAIPVLVDETNGHWDIRFHLAEQNPQCRLLASEPDCLLVFTGPNCYVSPSWYTEHPNVPTWNYLAVHVYGRVEPMPPPQLETLLRDLTRQFEPSVGGDWKYEDLPEDFRQELLAEIRGFRLRPSRVEAKSKLSQNRKPEDRERVRQMLLQSSNPQARAVGGWMAAPKHE